jgi:AraC-like DNA-binding protein
MPGVQILEKVESKFAPPSAETQCWLCTIARETWGRTSRCAEATIPYQAVFFVVEGTAWFSTRGQKNRVKKGDLFCCGPGVGHDIWCDEINDIDMLVFRFVGSEARQLMIEFLGETNLVCTPNNPVAIQTLLEHVLSVSQSNVPLCGEICSEYVRVILTTIKSGMIPTQTLTSKAYITFDACRRYIDQNFEEMESTQDAAHQYELEHAYLCRLFKRFLGTSPHSYWLRLKMNRAAHMLQSTNLSVKKIANHFHFSDSHAFSKAFKRLFGVAPEVYRTSFPVPATPAKKSSDT